MRNSKFEIECTKGYKEMVHFKIKEYVNGVWVSFQATDIPIADDLDMMVKAKDWVGIAKGILCDRWLFNTAGWRVNDGNMHFTKTYKLLLSRFVRQYK